MISKKYTLLSLLILIVMILTNPSELDYLDRIASDYGMMHTGEELDKYDLLEIGEGVSVNYFVFSRYQYSMGDVSVNYFGILNAIYFTGSGRKLKKYRESLAFIEMFGKQKSS